METWELIYEDARGAGVVKRLAPREAVERLKKLRRPARLMDVDVQVGGVDEADGSQDDQRIKWNWWYDAQALWNAISQPDEPAERAGGAA